MPPVRTRERLRALLALPEAPSPALYDATCHTRPRALADDPEVSLSWLMEMAHRTLEAQPEGVDATVANALERMLARRPDRDEGLGQLHIDTDSCVRRAERLVRDCGLETGPLLAVGDDDGVTLALALLGVGSPCAVDVDPRLLDFLAAEGVEVHRADFFADAVPPALRARFGAAITDPFRDLDGGLGFLCFAAACLRPGGDLYWVDDESWNPAHHRVRDVMARLGWHVTHEHRDVHAYPLTCDAFDPSRIVAELGVERRWIEALIEQTSAWSSIFRLRRAGGDG